MTDDTSIDGNTALTVSTPRGRAFTRLDGSTFLGLRLVRDAGGFRAWLADQGYSRRTCDLYGQYVGRCAAHLRASGVTLGRARADDLRSFWSTVPPSRSSRNGVRNALIAYYKFRGRRDGGHASELPNLPEPLALPRPTGTEEFAAFIDAAHRLGGEHDVLGCLLGFTGCRISEAEHARWSEFDLRSDSPAWYITGKGSRKRGPKIRKVDVNSTLHGVLARYRAQTTSADWLFPSTRSMTGHRGQTSLRRMVADICEEAKIERVPPHVWRHTVATIGLDRSHDIRATQELLGHASLATTQRYTKVLPGRLRALVTALEVDP